jgi:hypothetical protein
MARGIVLDIDADRLKTQSRMPRVYMFWKNHRSHLWGFLGGGFAGALGGGVRRPTNKVDELVGRVCQALLLAHPSPAPFQAGDVGRLELRGDGVGSPGARADAEILSNTTLDSSPHRGIGITDIAPLSLGRSSHLPRNQFQDDR